MNRPNLRTLDLHGLTWAEAEASFIEFYNQTVRQAGKDAVRLDVVHGYGSSGTGGVWRIRVQYREGDIDRREYQQESALTKAALDATRGSVDDEVVRYGDHIEGLVEAWGAATLEERHQLLSMMLDAVYVDMAQGLVLGLKPKLEFLPLFNLGEPVTTGDAELVTGGMEQTPTPDTLLFAP